MDDETSVGDKVVVEIDDGSFAKRIADRVNKALELDEEAARAALGSYRAFSREALSKIGWQTVWTDTRRPARATLFEIAAAGWRGIPAPSLFYNVNSLTSARVVERSDGLFDPGAGLLIRHMARNLNAVFSHSAHAAAQLRELMLEAVPVNDALGASGMCIPADDGEPPRISAFGLLFGGWNGGLTLCYVTDYPNVKRSELPASVRRQRDILEMTGFEVYERKEGDKWETL